MPVVYQVTTSASLPCGNDATTKANFQIRISQGTGTTNRSTIAIQQAPDAVGNYRDLFFFTGDGDVDYEIPLNSWLKYRVVNSVSGSTISVQATVD